jgi:hypothetical protein
MRKLTVILTALTVATFQTDAGNLDWLLGVANHDDIARREAKSLVWDGVSHLPSARFEKVDIVDKDWLFISFTLFSPVQAREQNAIAVRI